MAEIVGGALLGAAVGELLKAVIDAREKCASFKEDLRSLEITLTSITGHIADVTQLENQLKESRRTTKDLIDFVRGGDELVLKCTQVGSSSNYIKKVRYSKRLLEFDNRLMRYFSTVFQLDLSKDLKMLRVGQLDQTGDLKKLVGDQSSQDLAAKDIKLLNASATTLSDPTRIRVEELVMSRSIYNIVYRQQHARIYDETPIVCGTAVATNHSNQEATMQILLEYTEVKSTSWENSISLSLGVSTTIKVAVPFIADGNINFNTNVTGGHKWGGKEDVSLEMSTTYTAIIGAKKQVKLSCVASKGTCDVPFSYTQDDVFADGTRKVTFHDDGMFTGINYYNYDFIKQEDPL